MLGRGIGAVGQFFRDLGDAAQNEIRIAKQTCAGVDRRYQELEEKLIDARARNVNDQQQIIFLQQQLLALEPEITKARELEALCQRMIDNRQRITEQHFGQFQAMTQIIHQMEAKIVDLELQQELTKEVLGQVLDAQVASPSPKGNPPAYTEKPIPMELLMEGQRATVNAATGYQASRAGSQPFPILAQPWAPINTSTVAQAPNQYTYPPTTAMQGPVWYPQAPQPQFVPQGAIYNPFAYPQPQPVQQAPVTTSSFFQFNEDAVKRAKAQLDAEKALKDKEEQDAISHQMGIALRNAQTSLVTNDAIIRDRKIAVQTACTILGKFTQEFLKQQDANRILLKSVNIPGVLAGQERFPTNQRQAEIWFYHFDARNKALWDAQVAVIDENIKEIEKLTTLSAEEKSTLTKIPKFDVNEKTYSTIAYNNESNQSKAKWETNPHPFS